MTSTLPPATLPTSAFPGAPGAVLSVAAILEPAALAAAQNLAIGEPVEVGPLDAQAEAALTGAVVVAFSGTVTGEFAILLDAQVTAVLQDAAPGADLTTALAPAIDALAAVIGPVTTGIPQVLDPRLARHRIASLANTGELALMAGATARAAIAVGLEQQAGPQPPSTVFTGGPLARLDLLRGVEMQASAELGRARMTIHDLLSLRAGAVVELDRAAGDPADLYVNGRLMARGEVVVVEENYALRITAIVADEAAR